MATPLVSIVTATRNRPQVLAGALESIASQSLRDYELLIVDDGSPAEVQQAYPALLEPFEGRGRVIQKDLLRDKSGTPAIARNRGIHAARGKWVAFLDDDDRWVDQQHLEVAVRALETAGAELYFANALCVRDGRVEIPDCLPNSQYLTTGPLVHDHPRVFDVGLGALVKLLRNYCTPTDTTVVSRSLLLSVGGYCERIVFCEDLELVMRLVDASSRALYRPDPVAAYTLPSPGSHSLRVSKIDQVLDRLAAAMNVRAKCRSAAVRRCARQRESWALRELANMVAETTPWRESLRLAWQAAAAYPSGGSLWNLMRAASRCMRLSTSGS